jgi:AcrR family transcriptional regulator
LHNLSVNLIRMSAQRYRLGRRQEGVDRTRSAILSAAREVVAELGPDSSLGKVAARAGVSRITVYNQFGSKAGLFDALAVGARPGASAASDPEATFEPREELKRRIAHACAAWAVDPGLYRQLHGRTGWSQESGADRALVESLARADQLRPGCSIKEAEDVIGILTSFAAFDRLHQGGRRSASAVSDILLRLASGLLRQASP